MNYPILLFLFFFFFFFPRQRRTIFNVSWGAGAVVCPARDTTKRWPPKRRRCPARERERERERKQNEKPGKVQAATLSLYTWSPSRPDFILLDQKKPVELGKIIKIFKKSIYSMSFIILFFFVIKQLLATLKTLIEKDRPTKGNRYMKIK